MGKILIGVDGKAKEIKEMFIGVNGIAQSVKQILIGVDGIAKEIYNICNYICQDCQDCEFCENTCDCKIEGGQQPGCDMCNDGCNCIAESNQEECFNDDCCQICEGSECGDKLSDCPNFLV